MNNRRRKLIAAFLVNTINATLPMKQRKKQRRWWVRPAWTRRFSEGAYERLVKALAREDRDYFKRFIRMTPEEFQTLKGLIARYIRKFPAGRKALSPGYRLAITLRYLASGDSVTSTAFLFRIGVATASRVIQEVCQALWKGLACKYLHKPTVHQWKWIADGYERTWNFPHSLGSVDGKHIKIEAPSNSSTKFFNYKHEFSTVLMAVVDHKYKFIVADIGSYGSNSDGGIWKNSTFSSAFDDERVSVT